MASYFHELHIQEGFQEGLAGSDLESLFLRLLLQAAGVEEEANCHRLGTTDSVKIDRAATEQD